MKLYTRAQKQTWKNDENLIMKNSKEYAKKIAKLYRSLKRNYGKAKKVTHDSPTDALIYAILSEKNTESAANSAKRKLSRHFVDWNDLRVSRTEEIVEVLGGDNKLNRTLAKTLTKVLNAVFNEYNTISMESLTTIGKRPAKQALAKLDSVSPFVVSYFSLVVLKAHSIPLTAKMINYLRNNELVHPKADKQDIGSFLERQISASNGYEFYALLRRESESRSKAVENKSASKKNKKTKAKNKKARPKRKK